MEEIYSISSAEFPPLLREIDDPPKGLFVRGTLPVFEGFKLLCVVGSRRYTPYGKSVCQKLIAGLAGRPVIVVSGLALGLDGVAHVAAMNSGLCTIAIPGSGLDWKVLHPKTNHNIAKEILQKGGALLSEYPDDTKPALWTFPKRNRIMVGMSHATLVIEAEPKSGTLISARLAMEYNRDVLVVPGSILSRTSEGANKLIRDGAIPVASSEDILQELDIKSDRESRTLNLESLSKNEKKVFEMLSSPLPKDELIRKLDVPTVEANILISEMEIKGLIREELGVLRIA